MLVRRELVIVEDCALLVPFDLFAEGQQWKEDHNGTRTTSTRTNKRQGKEQRE